MGSRLERLNRIAVGIFNLNLFAAGTYLHFVSKTHTRLFQVSNASRQILHLKEHTRQLKPGRKRAGSAFVALLANAALKSAIAAYAAGLSFARNLLAGGAAWFAIATR